VIRLDSSVRRLDDDRVLLGGSPLRLLTLSSTARSVLASGDWDSRTGRALAGRLIGAGFAHPAPVGGPAASDLSVVIPVCDRPEGLRRLVAGLDPALELIVVDDGSQQPVPGAAVRHRNPRGPAAARNAGIALATRPFVALLDSDLVPPAGWLEKLLPHFVDSQVAAVAPRIVAARGSSRGWGGRTLARYDTTRSPLDLGSQPARVVPGSRVSYLPGAALVLRRSALGADPQAFDEGLRYGEDVDLVWRLIAAGWTVRYEPAAAVGHAHRATLRAAAAQRFWYGISAAPLATRHPGKLAPFAGNIPAIAAWALAAAGHPVAAGATLTVAAGRLARNLPVRRPLPLAFRVVGGGSLSAGRAIGEALTRPYGPVALPALVMAGKRGRQIALAALVLPAAAEYVRRRPELGPLRWVALRTVDDLAYGAGVWAGCLRERSLAALRPRLVAAPRS
jgi:mycofactocin glycosyltransferase